MSKQSLYTAIFLIGAVSLLNASEDPCELQRAEYLEQFKAQHSLCVITHSGYMYVNLPYEGYRFNKACELSRKATAESLEALRQCKAKANVK